MRATPPPCSVPLVHPESCTRIRYLDKAFMLFCVVVIVFKYIGILVVARVHSNANLKRKYAKFDHKIQEGNDNMRLACVCSPTTSTVISMMIALLSPP